jgi:hypothetical protein
VVQKKLLAIGNSVALIIDKPLRDVLGIKATTIVRVMTDGKRLIIEPCGESSAETTKEAKQNVSVSEQTRARQVAMALRNSCHFSNEYFGQLTRGWCVGNRLRVIHYNSWLEGVRWDELNDAERRVIRRFEAAFFALRRNASWDEAIRVALAAEPFDPDDPTEQDVGGWRQ